MKSLLIEILVKECSVRTAETKVTELTLFPTEKDLFVPDLLNGQRLTAQTSFVNLQELLLFEIDRLLKQATSEAELRIKSELDNLEPKYDEETGQFTQFGSWTQHTARLLGVKITRVDAPKLG